MENCFKFLFINLISICTKRLRLSKISRNKIRALSLLKSSPALVNYKTLEKASPLPFCWNLALPLFFPKSYFGEMCTMFANHSVLKIINRRKKKEIREGGREEGEVIVH